MRNPKHLYECESDSERSVRLDTNYLSSETPSRYRRLAQRKTTDHRLFFLPDEISTLIFFPSTYGSAKEISSDDSRSVAFQLYQIRFRRQRSHKVEGTVRRREEMVEL